MIAKNRFLNLVTLAAASVLTCAGGAQAAPVLVSGNTVPITTNPSSGSVTLNDYSVFRITLTPLATERITSIDVDTGSFGITGSGGRRRPTRTPATSPSIPRRGRPLPRWAARCSIRTLSSRPRERRMRSR